MSEIQGFGRWGQPQPVQEFGGRIPQALRFGGRVPLVDQESGRTWPLATRQEFGGRIPQALQFGGRIPFLDQGWRHPREAPPASRTFLH